MITNKDIRVENGNLVLNGDKYPLDGQSPEAIMQIVEDNSDTTPTENSTAPVKSGGVFGAIKDVTDTIGDLTQTGITGTTVANQLINKVKKLQESGDGYTATSTNFEYTGVSVTCPAGHVYIVRAGLSFSNSAPTEIIASKSDANTNVYNRLAHGQSGFITFMLLPSEKAYIWGKWSGTGANPVAYNVLDITI